MKHTPMAIFHRFQWRRYAFSSGVCKIKENVFTSALIAESKVGELNPPSAA